jgi:hypothetical protein
MAGLAKRGIPAIPATMSVLKTKDVQPASVEQKKTIEAQRL